MKIYDENQFTKSKLDERESNTLGLEDEPMEMTLENATEVYKMIKPFEKLIEIALIDSGNQLKTALNVTGEETKIKTKTKTAEIDYDEDREYLSVTIFKSIEVNKEIILNKGTKIRTLENGTLDAYMSFYLYPGPMYKTIAAAVNKYGIQKLQDGFYKKHKKDNMKIQFKINKNTVIIHCTGSF